MHSWKLVVDWVDLFHAIRLRVERVVVSDYCNDIWWQDLNLIWTEN
jgi:hypothetical protein